MTTPAKPDPVEPGTLLVAGASLLDPNFARTVILVCEHIGPGSFGLVLNRPTEASLQDLMEGLSWNAPVYRGGPVEENSLHFIHRMPDLNLEGLEVAPGIFWGGDFNKLIEHVENGRLSPDDCRFFIGYSGWGPGQLREEMLTDSWLTVPGTKDLVFADDPENLWRTAIRGLGDKYKILANFPDDPKLN